MKGSLLLTVLIILLNFNGLIAQNDTTAKSTENSYDTLDPKTNSYRTPTIGIGTGLLTFYGDLRDYKYGNPFVNNPAYKLYLTQPITDYLSVNLYALFGKMRVEERRVERNLNFESHIRASGISFEYNFSNFLKDDAVFFPFVSAGAEVFEFNSKTDLYNQQGEKYHYWSDGTIRNLDQSDPRAEFAVEISRDYDYETDIRQARFDNRGLYAKRGVAIPVGIGFRVKITNQLNFKMASDIHLSFTDDIDGINFQSPASRVGSDKGNPNNDHFLATTVSISYNFQKVDVNEVDYFERMYKEEEFDFYAVDDNDYDEDGVIDFYDKCANTPPGVAVDTAGCPIDTDGDGIADYKDKEINSPGTTVDANGVFMTDEMIYESYLRYIDSTGSFAEIVTSSFRGQGNKSGRFRVKVGEYPRGQEPEEISKLLSLPDLRTDVNDSTIIYSVGGSNDVNEAVKVKSQLNKSGFDASIEEKGRDNQYQTANKEINEMTASELIKSESANPNKVIFRVQLGAFKNKPADNFFKEANNLIVLQNNDIYRFYSGAYDSFDEAAKHKVKMTLAGFKGAYIVAFKGGRIVTLESVGVKAIDKSPLFDK